MNANIFYQNNIPESSHICETTVRFLAPFYRFEDFEHVQVKEKKKRTHTLLPII